MGCWHHGAWEKWSAAVIDLLADYGPSLVWPYRMQHMLYGDSDNIIAIGVGESGSRGVGIPIWVHIGMKKRVGPTWRAHKSRTFRFVRPIQ